MRVCVRAREGEFVRACGRVCACGLRVRDFVLMCESEGDAYGRVRVRVMQGRGGRDWR